MAKIVATKLDAARREIDAAIRMLFKQEDPIAVHIVAAAASRILRDLAKIENGYAWQRLTKIIRPGKEKEAFNIFNHFSNFLRHADHDPQAISENVDETVNDWTIYAAIILYSDLGHKETVEMQAFAAWMIGQHGALIVSEEFVKTLEKPPEDLAKISRSELLDIGADVLATMKAQS
jgi:hypothetical protein